MPSTPYRTYRQPSRWVLTLLAACLAGAGIVSGDTYAYGACLVALPLMLWGA